MTPPPALIEFDSQSVAPLHAEAGETGPFANAGSGGSGHSGGRARGRMAGVLIGGQVVQRWCTFAAPGSGPHPRK
jgi:hypothetical protein